MIYGSWAAKGQQTGMKPIASSQNVMVLHALGVWVVAGGDRCCSPPYVDRIWRIWGIWGLNTQSHILST